MRRLFLITSIIIATLITIGFSAPPASAYRGERDYQPPRVREYQSPSVGSPLYYSLAAGVWLPAHTSSVDASLRPTETHYNAGVGIGGAIGIDLGQIFRLENEVSYRYADVRNGDGSNWALAWMLNGWIETRNYSPVTPYFGGGFGLGRGHVATSGPSDGDVTGVAYQVGGGLDIRLDRRLSLDIGYRYFGISDTSDNNGTGSNDLAGSSVLAGLRVRF